MANTISPNMNLIIPTVGSESGPTYAFDVNASLMLIDQHDHTPGKGVQIVSAAININSDLDFQNNAAINLSRAAFQVQSNPSNVIQSLSVSAGSGDPLINDLWYTDSNGTQIQITENGQLAAVSTTVQGITYLTGGTFVFTQTPDGFPTRPANLDAGSITLRPNVDGTLNGVTLNASGVSSAYSLVLPTVPPVSSQFLTIDTTGVISGTVAVSGGITSSNIASNTIVATNVRNQQLQIPSTSKNADYSASSADGLIEYNMSGGPYTLTLYDPTVSNNSGQTITVKKTSNDFIALTVNCAGGHLIDDASSTSLNTYNECVVFQNDGTNWKIVSRTYPESWVSATFGLSDGITGAASQSSFVRRVGDSLECKVFLSDTTTAAALATLTLPSGLSVDTSKVANNAIVLGTAYMNFGNDPYVSEPGPAGGLTWIVAFDSGVSSQKVFLTYSGTFNGGLTHYNFNVSFGSHAVGITAYFTVPISGWN